MRNKSPGYTRHRKQTKVSTTRPHQGEVIPPNAEASPEGLLLRHPDFATKNQRPLACEARAQERDYSIPGISMVTAGKKF